MVIYRFAVLNAFCSLLLMSCQSGAPRAYSVANDPGYKTTLYRQNCAICHGPEGEGRTLHDGTVVPSLRQGEFKAIGEVQIYNQIAEGGNGMLPFKRQLSDREIRQLVELVHRDLRGN
ncbi:MAG: cytochrome c [Blastocatellia bacterium]|nr:cytochrome c [Blastocatellia bacterium]